jgi:hypothetical protein
VTQSKKWNNYIYERILSLEIFIEDPDDNHNPHYSNHRDPETKISLPSLVIHRPLHTEPYTEDTSQDREQKESTLTDAPPLVYRLQLVDGHNGVGAEIEDEE